MGVTYSESYNYFKENKILVAKAKSNNQIVSFSQNKLLLSNLIIACDFYSYLYFHI